MIRGPRDDALGRGLRDDALGRGPRDDALGRGPHDDALGRGPHDDALGRGPHDDALGRGPHDDALGRGPHDDALGRGPHDDALIIPSFDEEEEPPTTHIPIPAIPGVESEASDPGDTEQGTVDGLPPGLVLANAEKPTTHLPVRAPSNVSPARAISNLPAAERAALEAVVPKKPSEEGHRSPSLLAAKPGVIRRRSTRPKSAARPRAAMHHVRALHAVLMPFAQELVPLAFERRSRRFWARWREVAGDHGVRRPFVEELLRTSMDARSMVCELIAEVQSVDPKSVAALMEKLEQKGPTPGEPRTGRGRSSVMASSRPRASSEKH